MRRKPITARRTPPIVVKINDLVFGIGLKPNRAGMLAIHHLARSSEEMNKARRFAREACLPEEEWDDMVNAMSWHPFANLLGTMN